MALWILLGVGLALRLYGITLPLTDSHHLRQAQTAMMARNLYRDGMNILCTRLDFFGTSNKCLLMEFPVMHSMTAAAYYVFGVHEVIGRLINVGFSVGAMLLLYGVARQFLGRTGALFALGLYALSPTNIFFSRAFMPEASMMFFCLAALYLALRWLDSGRAAFFWGSLVTAAVAWLVKPTAGVIIAPIFAAWFHRDRWSIIRQPKAWIYAVGSLIPVAAWAVYSARVNALNPDVPRAFGGWLDIVFGRGGMVTQWISPAFYKFVGGSVVLLLLTPLGFLGMLLGMFWAPRGRTRFVLGVWLAAVIAYFYVLAGANAGHVYYHLHLLPVAAVYFGVAGEHLWTAERDRLLTLFHRRRAVSVATIVGVAAVYVAGYIWYFRYMYDTELRIPYNVQVAEVIKKTLPGERVLVVNEPGLATHPDISYESDSKVWSFRVQTDSQAVEQLERLRQRGATAYVAMDSKFGSGIQETTGSARFYAYLKRHFRQVAAGEHYMIFDLRAAPPTPGS